jgi:hypothetical protein
MGFYLIVFDLDSRFVTMMMVPCVGKIIVFIISFLRHLVDLSVRLQTHCCIYLSVVRHFSHPWVVVSMGQSWQIGLCLMVCTWVVMFITSIHAATVWQPPSSPTNDAQDDGIDRYLVRADGRYELPCGRTWLMNNNNNNSNEQPCNDLMIAALLATSSEYSIYRRSSNNTNIIITITSDLVTQLYSAPIIFVTIPYNITIIGQQQQQQYLSSSRRSLDKASSTTKIDIMSALNATRGPYQFQFIGPIHLTIMNLRIIRHQPMTSFQLNDGTLSINSSLPSLLPSSPFSASLILRNVEFNGHTMDPFEDDKLPVRGRMVSCHGLSYLIIDQCIFTNAKIHLQHEPVPHSVLLSHDMTTNSYIDISNTIFMNNIMINTGAGAMDISGASHHYLKNVTISNNHVLRYLNGRDSERDGIIIKGAILISNPSYDNNGNNSVIMTGCLISNNTIEVRYLGQSRMPVGNVDGFVNLASGAGMTLEAANVTMIHMSNSIFMNNSITTPVTTLNSVGAGFAAIVPQLFNTSIPPGSLASITDGSSSNIIVDKCQFIGNLMDGGLILYGGGLYLHAGICSIYQAPDDRPIECLSLFS